MIRTLLQDKSDKSDQAPPMSLALAQPPPPYVAPPMFSTCLLQRLIPTSPLAQLSRDRHTRVQAPSDSSQSSASTTEHSGFEAN